MPLGLVSHLTNDVERFWFRCVVAGEQETIEATMAVANAWQVGAGLAAADVLAGYRAKAVTASRPLDASPLWWPGDLFGS